MVNAKLLRSGNDPGFYRLGETSGRTCRMLTLIYIFAVIGYLSPGVSWIVYAGQSKEMWFTPDIVKPAGDKIYDFCEEFFADPLDVFVVLGLFICFCVMYAALWPIIVPAELIRMKYRQYRERRRKEERKAEEARLRQLRENEGGGVRMV